MSEDGGDGTGSSGGSTGGSSGGGSTDSTLREVDELVGRWLTVPDVAEVLGCDVTRVRSLLDDRQLVAVRRGQPRVLSVPAALVEPEPLPGLAGTLTVLADTGHDDLEALRWLFTPEETLGESPVAHLRAGHKAQVRRLAQALAF